MLQKQIRELSNYTTPLRSARIESALQGKIWDNYARWVLKEGLGQPVQSSDTSSPWWSEAQQAEWLACPASPMDGGFHRTDPSGTGRQLVMNPADEYEIGESTICAFAWTKADHPLACKYAFAEPVPPATGNMTGLAGDDEAKEEHTLHSLLAGLLRAARRSGRRWRHHRPRKPLPPPRSPRRPYPPGRPVPPTQPELPELDVPGYYGRIEA